MKSLSTQWIIRATGGRLVKGEPEAAFSGVCTDTRKLEPGQLFVALEGERVDGHDFLEQAAQAGATGVLVQRRLEDATRLFDTVVEVPDTLMAWCGIGRQMHRERPARVVAITGSTGKTTTKRLLAHILAGRFKVFASPASYNNEVGIPITLLQAPEGTEIEVLEYATRNPGDLRLLCQIASPEIAVITNIQESHLGRFGSRDALFDAKAELLDYMQHEGTAILNADDRWYRRLQGRARAKVLSFGRSMFADVSATRIRHVEGGMSFRLLYKESSVDARLPLLGSCNVQNALAAAAAALALGVPLAEIAGRLGSFAPAPGRLSLVSAGNFDVLDDSFNSSPASVKAALEVLFELKPKGRRVAVLADMLELGDYAPALHRQVGEQLPASGVDLLVTVGEAAKGFAEGAKEAGFPAEAIVELPDVEAALEVVPAKLQPGDLVLVKGSHAMGLERLVEALVNG